MVSSSLITLSIYKSWCITKFWNRTEKHRNWLNCGQSFWCNWLLYIKSKVITIFFKVSRNICFLLVCSRLIINKYRASQMHWSLSLCIYAYYNSYSTELYFLTVLLANIFSISLIQRFSRYFYVFLNKEHYDTFLMH